MFGLFKKNEDEVKVVDKVWISSAAKWRAVLAMAEAEASCSFVAWFPATFNDARNIVSEHRIFLADHMMSQNTTGRLLIFVEHYPLSSVEQSLFKNLNLGEVPVLSSLDEPFFMKFGGEKTIELMKRMGMAEDEMIGHSMITKSIRNAQAKIAAKVQTEAKAESQREWFEKNLR